VAPSEAVAILGLAGKFPIRGVITALVTPFTPPGEVDGGALREIVRFQLSHEVNGFFVCGTTGLGPAMPSEQRKIAAELVIKETAKRIPVIVQVGAMDPQVSFELASHAEKIGADAIASLTPFYYKPGEDAIIEYYRDLSESTALPWFVYNIPRNTGNNVDANLLRKLSKIPNAIGIKDSSQDFSQLLGYLTTVPEGFNVIVGTDSYLFSALCAGAQGGVSALANAFPELLVGVYEALGRKDLAKGGELQRKVHELRNALSEPPIAPLLEVLKLRGLKSGLVRSPLRSMTAAELESLRSSVTRILPGLKLAS